VVFRELLGTKFEPFTGRFSSFKRVDRGLKRKVFDLPKLRKSNLASIKSIMYLSKETDTIETVRASSFRN
jgi:hypothetical protein